MTAMAQYAKDTGRSAAATLFDIQKAFDNIKWSHLVRLSKNVAFPQNLLKLLHRLHSATRIIVVENTVASVFEPLVSVVAGCAYADQMMFIMMVEIYSRVTAVTPAAHTAVVTDDFQILAIDDAPGCAAPSTSKR